MHNVRQKAIFVGFPTGLLVLRTGDMGKKVPPAAFDICRMSEYISPINHLLRE